MQYPGIQTCRPWRPWHLLLPGILLVFAATGELRADDAVAWRIADGSAVTYTVVHPMHTVVGTSHALRGEIRFAPQAPSIAAEARVHVQADWQDFDSGNANRDSNVLQFVDARRYPSITWLVERLEVPADAGEAFEAALSGWLYVHGQRKHLEATARVDRRNPAEWIVETQLQAKLTDFGIEPPSLMFVKSRDEVTIDVLLRLQAQETPAKTSDDADGVGEGPQP